MRAQTQRLGWQGIEDELLAWNWGKVEAVLAQINRARAQGLAITANMYLYPASSTGLAARIPAWAHDGGPEALYRRPA